MRMRPIPDQGGLLRCAPTTVKAEGVLACGTPERDASDIPHELVSPWPISFGEQDFSTDSCWLWLHQDACGSAGESFRAQQISSAVELLFIPLAPFISGQSSSEHPHGPWNLSALSFKAHGISLSLQAPTAFHLSHMLFHVFICCPSSVQVSSW